MSKPLSRRGRPRRLQLDDAPLIEVAPDASAPDAPPDEGTTAVDVNGVIGPESEFLGAPVVHHDVPTDLPGRIAHIYRAQPEILEEYVLQELHGMLLAQVPMEQIAARFGRSIRTVYNWRQKLREKVSEEARSIDPFPILGATLRHYKSIRAAAWTIHNNKGEKAADRVQALQVALRTEVEQDRTLATWGVLKNVQVSPARTTLEPEEQGAASLMDDIRAIMSSAVNVAESLAEDVVTIDAESVE